ncbi:MAG: hypothetical protein V7637_818 [Mycobacteriales bacterium]
MIARISARVSGRRVLLPLLTGLALTGTTAAAHADTPRPAAPGPAVQTACGDAAAGHARCFAQYRTAAPRPGLAAAAPPDGYGPADLQSAYGLSSAPHGRAGSPRDAHPTVAVVDAFDDPDAEADLAVYRATYRLPPCTTANRCFTKINARGGKTPPAADPDWGVEISLDLDMVSATCPTCRIVLVEADDSTAASLATAENTAAGTGAVVISNSYGVQESPLMRTYAAAYDHRGVAIVASSGDRGFRVAQWPAVFGNVIAVGGTTLTRDPGSRRGWTETAWSGSGSGCSAFIRKPSWQRDRNCPMRTTADVSAVADPDTGVAVYDTFELSGWLVAGGTSASAPIIAAVYARAGDAKQIRDASGLYARANRRYLHDVVGGSNASSSQDCGGDYLCTGLPGYDAPTGVGTPRGTDAFESRAF